MSFLRSGSFIRLGLLIVVLHSAVLFFVIPKLSSQLTRSYNQDLFTDGYHELATNLVEGNGYRFYPETAKTLTREPGYPIFLAGLQMTFGGSFTVVKITNVMLALATAWLLMQLTKRILAVTETQNALLVIAPPILFLCHPGTLMAESRGGVEMMFAFLITLLMLTVIKAVDSNRWLDYLISGIVLGITVCVRSTPMLFPFVVLAYLLIFERKRVSKGMALRNIAVMILAMFVVLSPWIARNYSLTGKFVPTASVLGVSAQAGQYINTHLFEGRPFWLLDREASRERDRQAEALGYPFEDGKEGYYQTFYNTDDEMKFSKYLFGTVVQEYRKYPGLFVRCVAQNALNFWFAGKTWAATAANVVVQLPYIVLGLIGTFLGMRSKSARELGLLALFIGYIMAVHLPILAQARYSVPLIPLLSIPASIGLVALHAKIKAKQNSLPNSQFVIQ